MQKRFLLLNLLVIFTLILSTAVYSQEDYLFENISVADGLSSSSFNPFENIYQDKFGYLWFGTTDGLNRYDGYEFKVYKNIPGDTTTLPSSNIQTVTEDAEGNLWIGTPSYMSILNRKDNTFKNYRLDFGNTNTSSGINIMRSLTDSKGNFWITTQGRSVQKWNKEKSEWELIPLLIELEGVDTLTNVEVSATFALTELRNGNILTSAFQYGIFYYNESINAFEGFNFAGNEPPPGIVEIYEDRGGTLWLSGRNSFIEYNPKSFTFELKNGWEEYKPSSGDSFYFNINEKEDGTFLLCSIPAGLMTFDPTTDEFNLLDIGGELAQRGVGKYAMNKFIDKFGVYWVGLGDNGILKFDPNRKPFNYYTFEEDNPNQTNRVITTGIETSSLNPNELIISTDRGGFKKMNLLDRSLAKMNVRLPAITSDSSALYSFVLDNNNRIWFPSSALRISNYDLQTGKIETIKVIDKNMNTGGAEFIRHVEFMPKDKLIISTSIGGFVLNTSDNSVKELPSTMNREYSKIFIEEVKKTLEASTPEISIIKAGEAAALSQKLMVEDQSDFLIVSLGEGNHPNGIFDYGSITRKDGSIVWKMDEIRKSFYGGGGYKNRLVVEVITLEPGEFSVNFNTDVGHSYNNFNVEPPDNPEWYGIQVLKLDENASADLKAKLESEKQNNIVPDFYEASISLSSRKYPSDLWLGVDEHGIVRYNLATGKFQQYSIEDHSASLFSTNRLFEDSKGRLWITLAPSGFYRFIPETSEFISNSEIADLPLTGINGLIEDFQENIWVSSSGGITKLIENADGSWSTSLYDNKDGVPGGFGSGSLITRNGEIFFGSFNGVTAFYPSTENTSEPIPTISNITISDVSIFDDESSINLENSIFETDQLDLSFAQNDISFEFASLHYSRPSKNRVSYFLEGFNDHWIFTDKNFASFTNLEPGEYRMRIKAFSGFGIQSANERTLLISVAPPWYRTTAAYAGYVFLFIGLVFGIDRVQRKRVLNKERERQKIQEAELRAIAAEAQAKAAEAENERKSRELEEARQLQLSMLPKKLPQIPNLDIAVYMQTATEVGGDYYDFHVGLDGTLTVVVGDATGHGMKAGTMVTAAKSLFSTHAANPDILFTFSEISRCIKHMDMHLLTMCMTVLKIQQNKMIMSAAGMPPTLLYRNNTKQLEEITIKGMPLGAVDQFPYDIRETELNSGDTLFLMSDGLPELFDQNKELYGYERVQNEFHKVAEKSPEQIIDRLKSTAVDWAGGSEPNDDVTFVVIKVK